MAEPAFAIGELVKLVVALGVTIGLFYALALFMKRLQVGTGKSGTLIKVLGALPLGNKEKIWVLDIAGEKLVVGTTTGSINCLHVLKETTEAAAADSSFPRRRESGDVGQDAGKVLDSRLRGNDEKSGDRFLDLLKNFRGGHKS